MARDCVENIKSAKSPEEAARIGRSMQRQHPDLVWFYIDLIDFKLASTIMTNDPIMRCLAVIISVQRIIFESKISTVILFLWANLIHLFRQVGYVASWF